MPQDVLSRVKVYAEVERWPLTAPFRITGFTFEFVEALVIYLERDGFVGRGEASGVHYRNDKPSTMFDQIESVRATIETGTTREALQTLLPRGGARNALDCALWDLESKLSGQPVWQLAGLSEPRPLLTTFTCGADDPDRMAEKAIAYTGARAIKLKLTGERADVYRVRAVREVLPDVWLAVDANQGFSPRSLERLMPTLLEMNVALIEQPFPVGQEAELDGFRSAIPIVADESVQGLDDLAALVGRFGGVNIKLDKCGGLTEALAMVRAADRLGLDTMVGNMIGTSLAMAPAFVVGQLCKIVDLDGVVFLKADREPSVKYEDGLITCSRAVWG